MKSLFALPFAFMATAGAAQDVVPTWVTTSEGLEAVGADRELRKKTTILRQRLVPRGLAVLRDDAVRQDGGDRWAKSGEQVFAAMVDGKQLYCVLKSKANLGSMLGFGGLMGGSRANGMVKQDCFLDTDGDGSFDERYKLDPGVGVLPNVSNDKLTKSWPLQPTAYEEISPLEFDPDNWMEIRFLSDGKASKKVDDSFQARLNRAMDAASGADIYNGPVTAFQIRYRYDGKTRELSNPLLFTSKFPQTVSIYGSQIELTKNDNGRVLANVISPMSTGFEVEVTITVDY